MTLGLQVDEADLAGHPFFVQFGKSSRDQAQAGIRVGEEEVFNRGIKDDDMAALSDLEVGAATQMVVKRGGGRLHVEVVTTARQ